MYKPSQNLLEVIRNAMPLQQFPWDEYFTRMAETDFLQGIGDQIAVKSFFIRKAPFGGSFATLGGVTEMLRTIDELRLDDPALLAGLRDMDYRPEFVAAIAKRGRLQLKVYSPPEGSVFFPNEPVVSVVGPLIDVRLVEGIMTEALNFPILSLTKWNRFVRTVWPGQVMDFSRRRAQNYIKASLYAMLGGCSSTSNVELRRFADVKVTGTMGHEFVQSRGGTEAFGSWLKYQPRRAFGLVDTNDCMRVDFPAWLVAVYEHREEIKAANPVYWGWRNDSGDLAYLTIEQYRRFMKHHLASDQWFRERMRIVLTNDLDEYAAQSIIAQIRTQASAAGFDAEDILRRIIWAAGTKPGTCDDQPALGGVAKLMKIDGHDTMKLAFDAEGNPGVKTSFPGFNRSAIIRDKNGEFQFLFVYPAELLEVEPEDGKFFYPDTAQTLEHLEAFHPDNPGIQVELSSYHATAQQRLMHDSLERTVGSSLALLSTSLQDVQNRVRGSVDSLPWTVTRLDKPEVVKVLVHPHIYALRQKMIAQRVIRSDKLTD